MRFYAQRPLLLGQLSQEFWLESLDDQRRSIASATKQQLSKNAAGLVKGSMLSLSVASANLWTQLSMWMLQLIWRRTR